MKTRTILILISFIWLGLSAQQIDLNIQASSGDCLLQSDCESNTVCFDLSIEVDEPNWELRSYNIWVHYPSPPSFSYNSDNACFAQNSGDTDNNQNGQYRVGGADGSLLLEPGIPSSFHSICFEYTDGNSIQDSLIGVGGVAMVYGFPFETTVTMRNTATGENAGFSISSFNNTTIKIDNKQVFDFESGWSGVSAWMEPDQTDIEFLMSPVVDELVLMYNLTEGIYSPVHNINTINNWNYKSGYIMKVNDDVSLNMCGAEPENKDINLMAGWNVIPVLSKQNVPIELVFDEMGDNLVIVKEIAGYQIYYPEFSINSLSSLEPGKAYFVRVLESCTITFPGQVDNSPSSNQEYCFDLISPWDQIHNTPESHVYCFNSDVAIDLNTGDMIGAFDQNGNCTGMMEILDTKNAFTVSVFGDDNTTEAKDGMIDSELCAFTLYKIATGEVFNIDLAFADNSPNHENFVSNGISIVKDILISTTGTEINNYLSGVDLQIFPNPTHGETNIKLSGDVRIDGDLILTDSRGQLIYRDKHFHNGGVTFHKFDFSKYSPGAYYLRLISENYLNIQKIVVK